MSTQKPNTRQTSISPILTKLGWFDLSMGQVDHAQYFWSGVTPCGWGSPTQGPILLVKPKIHLVAAILKPNCMVNFFYNSKCLVVKFSLAGQNCAIFTKYAIWPKSTLLIKIFEIDLETKIFLYKW